MDFGDGVEFFFFITNNSSRSSLQNTSGRHSVMKCKFSRKSTYVSDKYFICSFTNLLQNYWVVTQENRTQGQQKLSVVLINALLITRKLMNRKLLLSEQLKCIYGFLALEFLTQIRPRGFQLFYHVFHILKLLIWMFSSMYMNLFIGKCTFSFNQSLSPLSTKDFTILNNAATLLALFWKLFADFKNVF